MTVKRPGCAGYYTDGDVQCDGHSDRAEPACRYRDRCNLLIELGGGRTRMGEADPDNNAHVLRLFDEADLDEHLESSERRAAAPKHKPAHKAPARVRRRARAIREERESAYALSRGLEPADPNPTPRDAVKRAGRPPGDVSARRVGRPTPVRKQSPRPAVAFAYTLPILDTFADHFAARLEARRVPETDAHAEDGDVYVHYTRHARGRRAVLFRCVKEHKTKNHKMCAVWLYARNPWIDLTLPIPREKILEVMNLRPPRGTRVFVSERISFGEEIRVEGVTPELVSATVAWFVRVYLNGLIPMRRVTARKS